MGVALFEVAKLLDKLLDGDGLLVLVGVALGVETRVVDEDVGVSGDTGDSAADVVVDLVHLLALGTSVEEVHDDALLGRKNDSVRSKDSDRRSSVADGLHGVLDLVETALW